MHRFAAAVTAILVCAPALAQEQTARLIAECDRLAASDQDMDLPAPARGVPFSAVDGTAAVAACLAAAKAAPSQPRVIFQLGRALQAAKKDEDARSAYQLADTLGYPIAAYGLGTLLWQGIGGSRDLTEAVKQYQKAAAAGVPLAMRALASAYETGSGINRDVAEAARWYEKSVSGYERLAARGSPSAMFELGRLHHAGQGAPKDLDKARLWFEKAATAGYPAAMNTMGVIYERGEGVSRDLILAERWYAKAAAGGDRNGGDNLRRLRNAARPGADTPAAPARHSVVAMSAGDGRPIAAELRRTQDNNWIWDEKLYFRTVSETPAELVIFDARRDIYHRFDLKTREEFIRQGVKGDWRKRYSIVSAATPLNRIEMRGNDARPIAAELKRTGSNEWVWSEKYYFHTVSDTATEVVIYDGSRDTHHRLDLNDRAEFWRVGTNLWNKRYTIVKAE